MPADQSVSPASEPSRFWNLLRWPWRQLCGFLMGLSFFVMGMERLTIYSAVYFRLISPTPQDQTSLVQGFALFLILGATGCGIVALGLRLWRFLQLLSPPIRLPWLGWSGGALFVIGILAQTIALGIPATLEAHRAQQQAVTSGPWYEHSFAGGAVRLSTSPNWEVVQDPKASPSSIYMVDRQNASFLTAVLVPKQDLAVKSLMELAQQSASLLAGSVASPASGEMLPAELAGNPAIDIVQSGTLQGVNQVWRTRNIEYPDAWLELRLWTTHSRYESQSATFDRIAQSIRREK